MDAREAERLVRTGYERVVDFYTDTFAAELERKPFDRHVLARFVDGLPPGLVCDVGCGPAHVGEFVGRFGVPVCGVDLAFPMLVRARALTGGIPAVQANMLALPFRDGALAGVIAFYSLIHLLRADVPAAIAEFARVLNPGGRLVLAAHAGEGAIEDDAAFGGRVPMFATLFTRPELVRVVEAAGLTVDDALQRSPYTHEGPTERLYLLAAKPG